MNQKPLCTVILPTIGRPQYFGAALASVAAQTYQPMEILVSDNAANPPVTVAELERWAPGANIRLIRRAERIAGPEHINLCVGDSSGEYVFFMSDDDLIAPDLIRASMDCILSDAEVGAVVSSQTTIGECFSGSVPHEPITYKTIPGDDFAEMWINGGNPGVENIFPMLVSKDKFLGFQGFRPYPTGNGADLLMFFQLCLGRKVGLVDGGYHYRIYPSSEGLAAPWKGLRMAVECYDRDLHALYLEGRLKHHVFQAMVRGNTGLLVHRRNKLYAHRKGLENTLVPIFDIAFRILANGWKYGVGSIPLLHKILSSR